MKNNLSNPRGVSFLPRSLFVQTDSEVACEEAARLTAELQEDGTPYDEEIEEVQALPPPPDGG